LSGPLSFWTSADVDAAFRTLYGEVRGEPPEGQVAVMFTLINRAKLARVRPSRMFGDGTIRGACMAPAQFSCWPGNPPLAGLGVGVPSTARQLAVVLGVLLGDLGPPAEPWWSDRITHYHVASDPFPEGWTPRPTPDGWKPPPPTGIVAHHAFYSEDVVP